MPGTNSPEITSDQTLFDRLTQVSAALIKRSAMIRNPSIRLTLPVVILLSFIPMSEQNLTANIMSLGGIAVAIGAMVDADPDPHRDVGHFFDKTPFLIKLYFSRFRGKKPRVPRGFAGRVHRLFSPVG